MAGLAKLAGWAGVVVLVLMSLYVLVGVILAGREAAPVRERFAALEWTAFDYASSVDGTAPLHALAVWPRDRQPLPLLVMMHGYTESAARCFSAATRWARRGWLVLLPDMRGRRSRLRYPLELLARRRPLGVRYPGWRSLLERVVQPVAAADLSSAGLPDSGGLEVHDIRDAVVEARQRLGRRLEPGAAVVGYSGGGSSALLAAVRFPGLFRSVTAYFPIVDFAAQAAHLQRLGRGPRRELLEWIGGTPEQVPGRYAGRSLVAALGNLRRTPTLVLADSEDPLCPVSAVRELGRAAEGMGTVEVRISGPGQARRWHHETPDEDSALHDIELPAPADGPDIGEGSWVVPGYLVAPGLEVWLGDGRQGLARCDLRRAAGTVTLRIEPLEVGSDVTARVRVRDDVGRWHERRDLPLHAAAELRFAAEEEP